MSVETMAGKTVADSAWSQVLTTHGQITSSSVNIEQAIRLFIRLLTSPEARAGKDLARSAAQGIGKVVVWLQVILGGWTYVEDMMALWTDPNLDPRIVGNRIWLKRIGVGLEGLGGGLLAVGGLMAIFSVSLLPVAAVLLPVGLAAGGIGLLLKNWDSIANALVNGWNAWKDNFRQMGEITHKLIHQAASVLSRAISAGGQAACDTIIQISHSAATVTRSASAAMASAVRRGGSAIANFTQKVSAVTSSTVRAMGNTAAMVTRTLSSAVSNTVQRASASIAGAVKHLVSSVPNPVTNKVGNLLAGGIVQGEKFIGSSVERAGEVVAVIQQQIGNGLAQGIQRIGNTLANLQRSAGNVVGNAIQRAGNTIADVQRKIGNVLGISVKSLANRIGDWFVRKP